MLFFLSHPVDLSVWKNKVQGATAFMYPSSQLLGPLRHKIPRETEDKSSFPGLLANRWQYCHSGPNSQMQGHFQILPTSEWSRALQVFLRKSNVNTLLSPGGNAYPSFEKIFFLSENKTYGRWKVTEFGEKGHF